MGRHARVTGRKNGGLMGKMGRRIKSGLTDREGRLSGMRYAISFVVDIQRLLCITVIVAGLQHRPYMTTTVAGPREATAKISIDICIGFHSIIEELQREPDCHVAALLAMTRV